MYKNRYLISFICIVLCVFISVLLLGRIIEYKLSAYVEEEVNRVSKILIRDILDKDFLDSLNLDDLYIVERNSNNELEMVNFNMGKINEILGIINDEIIYYFDKFERGEVELLYEAKLFDKIKDYMIIEVPLGSVLNNPILSNIGPKMPIKLLFSGDVEADVDTSIKEYGINNVLLEIDVKIVVVEKIIFPFSSRSVEIFFDFPLAIELISGKVPENYLNS